MVLPRMQRNSLPFIGDFGLNDKRNARGYRVSAHVNLKVRPKPRVERYADFQTQPLRLPIF